MVLGTMVGLSACGGDVPQESLLSAQLNEAANLYNGSQAVISLYIALGGGTK